MIETFNSSIRYIDDELSLNNSRFNDYLHLIYPNKVVVKNATYTQKSASYIDLHFESTMDWKQNYDKRDDFIFQIVNFPFVNWNIPAAPAYGVYISQLMHNSGACS